ncbi:hypothetical protein A2230_08290 [candidate division WOR-1 bacterium RIFOXYA2_FULL_36_21]|uniref:Pyruvate carboxyltransferase domain-containing protein n=1 Tax=candidate division WOR-1 bacterium RIFOXYB2_FULL_36_35 TaxID=1802578 RepID=A0A1F4S8B7_UNCSA|nr:MAG: hypothetical protein A2230_08290 [candidate division WOR-1 bacterium RIFOXYA2_FULL_36_21]OGC16654.1 MAG: hypothetical protein A2290_03505 [candidate division WOR-1 bacterium RIFOXYB2_FULL_36_35]OGC16970.1 MAG: hypothetical protein A2282_02465 [candidate division WOR-1 bacterium RIFOXYA12_FULL_36_13]
MKDKNKIEILDCTIRDGGYVNNWDFDLKLVRETYRALSKAGIDYIELGYHGVEHFFDPKKFGRFRFTSFEDIKSVTGGINGAKIALMVDYGKFDLNDLNQYLGTNVSLIRLAFHKDKAKEAVNIAGQIKRLGFLVSVNLMGYISYSTDELNELVFLINQEGIDYVYIADSYGSMFPHEIKELFTPLLKDRNFKLGFHPHNNLLMSFANTFAAIDAGVDIVDSSVFGMGRGAGNLPTEILLSYFHQMMPGKYNVIPVLNLIDRFFVELKEKNFWGYNLPYMLSGINECHPNYAKNLVERKEYDIEDIWNIFEVIKAKKPIGFKKDIVDQIIRDGLFGKKKALKPAENEQKGINENSDKISYVNRHNGSDFLVLANGPSLKKYKDLISLFIEKYKPIVLGANYLGGLFVPDYHLFTNKRRFVDYVDTVSLKSKLLIGQHIPKEMIDDYVRREYELIYYNDLDDVAFDIKDGLISSNCRTVSIFLIALSWVFGAKRIFVAGLDGYMRATADGDVHFYKENDETGDRDVILDKHFGNLKHLEEIEEYLCGKGGEGIHIITPTNYRKFYKGINNYL